MLRTLHPFSVRNSGMENAGRFLRRHMLCQFNQAPVRSFFRRRKPSAHQIDVRCQPNDPHPSVKDHSLKQSRNSSVHSRAVISSRHSRQNVSGPFDVISEWTLEQQPVERRH
jgi:hypothetical protein